MVLIAKDDIYKGFYWSAAQWQLDGSTLHYIILQPNYKNHKSVVHRFPVTAQLVLQNSFRKNDFICSIQLKHWKITIWRQYNARVSHGLLGLIILWHLSLLLLVFWSVDLSLLPFLSLIKWSILMYRNYSNGIKIYTPTYMCYFEGKWRSVNEIKINLATKTHTKSWFTLCYFC